MLHVRHFEAERIINKNSSILDGFNDFVTLLFAFSNLSTYFNYLVVWCAYWTFVSIEEADAGAFKHHSGDVSSESCVK